MDVENKTRSGRSIFENVDMIMKCHGGGKHILHHDRVLKCATHIVCNSYHFLYPWQFHHNLFFWVKKMKRGFVG